MNAFGLNAVQLESAGARWTAREVLQQPQIWAEIERQIAAEAVGLAAFLNPLLHRPELRIVLTGAGTSAHIGECLAPALTRTLARRVDAISTTDLVASPQSYLTADTPTLMVSFGRSGNSPESMAAIGIADEHLEQCHHLIFTCDAAGALYQHATRAPRSYVVRLPEASNDRGFAMTSSFTGMLLAAKRCCTVSSLRSSSAWCTSAPRNSTDWPARHRSRCWNSPMARWYRLQTPRSAFATGQKPFSMATPWWWCS